jgi:hypothetical protein
MEAEAPGFDVPGYLALSYVWGAAEPKRTIYVTGQAFDVTPNFHEVLTAFHSYTDIVGRYIWIDAVCMNRSDLDERTKQIAIMRGVYSTADCVHIWLGQSTGRSAAISDIVDQVERVPMRQYFQGELDHVIDQVDAQQVIKDFLDRP